MCKELSAKDMAAKALIEKYGPEQAREMTIGPMREAVEEMIRLFTKAPTHE